MIQFRAKYLTLVELIVASVFLFFVFIGAGLLLNFVLQQGLLNPKRMMDLEEPVNYAFSHIQKQVFPAEEINLLGAIIDDTASAVEVIHDTTTAPATGVIYALTDKDGDGNARELCYWDHVHKSEYPDSTNAKVLAKSISRVGFGNAQAPSVHNQFGLLKVQITAHDYEWEGKPDQIKDFTYTCSVFARRARSTAGGNYKVYNYTQKKLYLDLDQSVIDEASNGDEIWLSGYNWEISANQEEFTNGFTYSKLLYIQGGYKFAFDEDQYEDKTKFNEGNTVRDINTYQTVFKEATVRFQGLRNIAMGDPDYSYPETPVGSGGYGYIDGITFEGKTGLGGTTGFALESAENSHINYFPLISNCIFREHNTAINIGLGNIVIFYQWHTKIQNCIFDDCDLGISAGNYINDQCPIEIERCFFRNSRRTIWDHNPLIMTGDGDCETYEVRNITNDILDFISGTGNTKTITDVNFRNNDIATAGDLWAADTTFNNCTFENLTIERYGPSIFNDCDFSGDIGVVASESGNRTFNNCDLYLGSIGIHGSNIFSHCRFFNNNNLRLEGEITLDYSSFYNNTEDGVVPPPTFSPGDRGIIAPQGNSTISHCVFYNNTVLYPFNPTQQGILWPWAGSNIIIDDAIFFNNTPNDLRITSGTINLNYSAYEQIYQSGGNLNIDASSVDLDDGYPGYIPFVDPDGVDAFPDNDFLLDYDPANPANYPCVDIRPLCPAPGCDDDDIACGVNRGTEAGDMGIYGGSGCCGW